MSGQEDENMEQIPLYAQFYPGAPPRADSEERCSEFSLMPTRDELSYLCGEDEDLSRVVIINI